MIKKFRRNSKALSPIFAVLILIAIAVIAGIIVYMFTSGYLATMMGGGTAAQEKVAVQGVDVDDEMVYAQSVGGTDVLITNWILKDSAGKVVAQGSVSDGTLGAGGSLATVKLNGFTGYETGKSYTVTLVSSKGGSFVSPAFVP